MLKKERKAVLELGAKYDEVNDVLYTTIDEINKFKDFIHEDTTYCENLYLLECEKRCWRCDEIHKQYLLASDKMIDVFDNGKVYTDVEIFTYVIRVPEAIKKIMNSVGCDYRYSKTVNFAYLMNICPNCKATHGDYFLHDDPTQAIYRHLLYKDEKPCKYHKIESEYLIPIRSRFVDYDAVAYNPMLVLFHMQHPDVETFASMMVNQKTMNHLLDTSIRENSIMICR